VKSNPTLIRRWSLKGQQPEINTYYGYTAKSIFGSVNLTNGDLIYRFASRQNQKEFIRHLRQILNKYPKKTIWLYADRAGWHTGRRVKQFLHEHKRLKLKHLPAYSPQLNPVERLWKFMRLNVTHNRFYRLVPSFEASLRKFFKLISRKNKKIYALCSSI